MDKLNNTWEEIVFEHRNKDYGAYVLRYNYPRYLTISALIVISIFLIFMAGMNKSESNNKQEHKFKKVTVVGYTELSAPPPIEKIYVPPKKTPPKKPPKEPPKKVVVQQPKVEKYVVPIVTQEEIEEPEEMITVAEAKEIIDSTDNSDENTETVVAAQSEPAFDINPGFPGGRMSFKDWLKKHLKYPAAAKRMGIEGNVIVGFLVDKNGKISEVSIIESLHRLCDREAMRVVKLMPAWIPGVKKGKIIGGKHTLEIPFVINIAFSHQLNVLKTGF